MKNFTKFLGGSGCSNSHKPIRTIFNLILLLVITFFISHKSLGQSVSVWSENFTVYTTGNLTTNTNTWRYVSSGTMTPTFPAIKSGSGTPNSNNAIGNSSATTYTTTSIGEYVLYNSTSIDASSYSNQSLTLDFKYKGAGEADNDYFELVYTTGTPTTYSNWTTIGTNRYCCNGTTVITISGVELPNSCANSNLYIGFRYLQKNNSGGGTSIFFDDITLKAPPYINTSVSSLQTFSTCSGTNSAEQTFTVDGGRLSTNNITITAPTGFEVSKSSGTGFASSVTCAPSSGSVGSTTIYVRTTTGAAQGAAGSITCTSTNAISRTIAVASNIKSLPTSVNAGADVNICSGSSTSLSGSSSSSTTLFFENFENATVGRMPSGAWTGGVLASSVSGRTDNGLNVWSVSSTSPITAIKSMTIYDAYSLTEKSYRNSNTTSIISYTTSPINAAGFSNLKLNFKWQCTGEANKDYGQVAYSADGTTWTLLPTKYQSQSATQTVSNLDISIVNNSSFYLGFVFITDGSTGSAPPFTVDDITVTGDVSSPTYIWSPSTGLSATNISNPTANPTSSTTYTMTATVNGCSQTDQVVVSIVNAVSITSQPSAATVCVGGQYQPSITVSGGGSLTYQWEYSANGTSGWASVANGTPTNSTYTNATTTTLTVSGSIAAGNYYYRCKITDAISGCTATTTSNSAQLTVNAVPSITTSPSNTSICYGSQFQPTVVAAGGITLSYQWQFSTDNSIFNNVANSTPSNATYTNATTATLTVAGNIAAGSSYYYRCVVSSTGNGCSNATSSSAQLTISGTPTTANAGGDISIPNCSPSVKLGANTPTTGTGTWSVVAGSQSTLVSQFTSTSSATTTFTPAAGAGTYTLRWTISNGACANSTDDVVITVGSATSYSGTLTVGNGGYIFSSLNDAITKLNTCGYTGNIILELQSNYDGTSTTEGAANPMITIPSTFNSVATSDIRTITIRPASGVTGKTITSSSATGTVLLNGADYIYFNGSPGAGNTMSNTNNLSIINTETTNKTGYAIRFAGDATNNKIEYCNVKANPNSYNNGVIIFNSPSTTTGNSYNEINYCEVTKESTTPTNCIYSVGAVSQLNKENKINGCYIYDFFHNTNYTHSGVFIHNYNTDWSITDNRFYQTVPRDLGSSSACHRIININYDAGPAGNNFTITGNTIGGSQSNNTGTYAFTGEADGPSGGNFSAIYLKVGTTQASTVSNNTIKNISLNSVSTKTDVAGYEGGFNGIAVLGGKVNIGSFGNGNTIGSTSDNNSISYYAPHMGNINNIYGIYINSTSDVTVAYNNIGGFYTHASSGTLIPYTLAGIYNYSTGGTISITNNTIGSTTQANSISVGLSTSSTTETFYGIYSSSTGAATINSNTIQNIVVLGTSTNNFYGLYNNQSGSNTTINSNNINTVTVNGSGTFYGLYNSATSTVTINSNTVNNILVYGTTATTLSAIHNTGGTTTISLNTISNITRGSTAATAAALNYMIYNSSVLTVTISSNSISNITIYVGNFYGIYDNSAIISDLNTHTISSNTIGSSSAGNISLLQTSVSAVTRLNKGIYVLVDNNTSQLGSNTSPIYTVTDNVIRNFTQSNDVLYQASFTGIEMGGSASASYYVVRSNSIYNIKYTHATSRVINMYGIYLTGGNGNTKFKGCVVEKNKIYGYEVATTHGGTATTFSTFYGIYASTIRSGGTAYVTNNFIYFNNGSFTNGLKISGIELGQDGATVYIVYNTVFIENPTGSSGDAGSSGGGNAMYQVAFCVQADNYTYNNIFYNYRTSTCSNSKYAISKGSSLTSLANWANNYGWSVNTASYVFVPSGSAISANSWRTTWSTTDKNNDNGTRITAVNMDGSLNSTNLGYVTGTYAANSITGCTYDINGTTGNRNTSPYTSATKGCYEGTCMSITVNPSPGSVCFGSNYTGATFTVQNTASSASTFTYTLQYSSNNNAFTDYVAGTPTNATYTGATATTASTAANSTVSPTASSVVIGGSIPAGSSYYYRFKIVSSQGCTDYTSGGQLTVNALPTITGSSSVCMGSALTLTGSGTAATSNAWSSSDVTKATINTTTTTGTVTPVSVGSSNIVYTDNNGCQSTTKVITVNGRPTITGSSSVCIGSTLTLTGSGTAATSNAWSSSDITKATINTTTTTGTVTPVAAGTTNITYTDNNGCSSNSSTITVGSRPSSAILAGDASICNGSSSNLTVTVTGGTSPYTVVYTGNGGGTVNSYTSGSNIPQSPSTSTTYGLTSVTDANGCTASSLSGAPLITVNQIPTATWSSTATSVCYNASAQTTTLAYSATTNTPPSYSITWNASPTNSFVAVTDQANTFTAAGGSGTISIAIPAGTAAGTYTGTITVKNANSCTSTSSNFTVTVNASVAGTAASDQGITYNATAGLTLAGSTGSIQWQESSNGSTSWANVTGGTGGTTATYTTANLTADNYYRAVVTYGSCISDTSNTVAITITSSPTISTSTSALTAFSACSGSNSANQTFTVSGSNLTADIAISSPTGYEISTSSGSGFGSSLTLTQASGSVSLTTIYVRTTTGASNGASGNISASSTGATTKNITTSSAIILTPLSGFSYTTNSVSYCTGSQITANNVSITGGGTITYSVSPNLPTGLSISSSTGQITGTPTVPTSAANYVVTATNGSCSATSTVNITVLTPLSGFSYTTNSVSYCTGSQITANSVTITGGGTITYSVSPTLPTGLLLSSSTGQITGTPTLASSAADYVVTASNGGCSATSSINITVLTALSGFSYTTNSVSYPVGSSITANSVSITGGGTITYSVSPSLPTGLSISSSTGEITGTPSVTTSAANYIVTASNGSCTATSTINITIISAATTFYYLGTGNMDNTSSWWSGYSGSAGNYTGTGSHPSDITLGSQVFYIYSSLSSNNDWTLGSGSKIIVGDGTNASNFTITSGNTIVGTIDVTDNATLTIEDASVPTLGTLNSGSTVVYNCSSTTQSLQAGKTYGNLTVDNSNGVSLDGNATVSGALTLTDGTLTVGAHTLTISGSSITRGNGNIDASNGSALLSFTNGSALTLPSSCFTGNINRMTLNGAGGVSLGSNTTVSSTLTLTSGTLTVGANTLTLANNSAPVRTSGNIDLSNASAEIEFTNTSGVTLPASLFSGNISKWKMNGTGGITLNGNTTITTTLTLSAGKLIIPASTTLSLGSTSADIDDLSGSSSSYIVTTNNTSAIRRYVNSKNDHLYTFPMGDATYYSPMTFRLNNSTSSISNAYLTTYVVDGYVPGFNQSQYITKISRYWSVEPFGMTSPNYDISYTYDDNDLSGNETALLPIKKSGATWYKPNNAVNITTGTKEGVGSVNDVTNTLTWTGLTTFSFDTGTGDEAQALPIHLLYFTAKPQSNRVRLDWATASETNNDYFTVERSQDGEHFNELFKKPGAGITTTNLYYFGYDNKPLTGTSYYRLKQTDFDGKFEYSDIESVSLQASVVLDGLKIYPNPSEDNVIHVDFSSESKQEVTCVLHDAVGKEIATEIFEVQKGPNGFTLSYPSVATGMYILEIRSSEGGVHQTQLKLGK